jgi:hypothetical protein
LGIEDGTEDYNVCGGYGWAGYAVQKLLTTEDTEEQDL